MKHKIASTQQEVTSHLRKTDDKDFLTLGGNQRQLKEHFCHSMFRRDDGSLSSYQVEMRIGDARSF
jgi:hypothetical protein